MIFDLARDLDDTVAAMPAGHPRHRILGLLAEAARRDIHFIARHPTTLFQCLWNTCWWYDCPDAANHRDPPADGSRGQPPWRQPGAKLNSVLMTWRLARDNSRTSPAWAQSRRPPVDELGIGQRAAWQAAEDCVLSARFSPNGELIATVGRDGALAAGRCLPAG